MKLEIRRSVSVGNTVSGSISGGNTISGITPATAYPVGKPIIVSAIDPVTGAKTFALANGRVDGFLTRATRVPTDNDSPSINGNPRTAEEMLMGWGMDVPFTAGREGSIEGADWIEAEGADYVLKSGTGSLAAASVGAAISFINGLFYGAQSGDMVQFRLAQNMTPETAGDTRILFQRIDGYIQD